MTKYIIRRTLIALPMLLAISIMTFAFINLAPGDPVDAMIDPEFFVGGAGDKLRARLGLDKPIHERYILWLIEVSPLSSSCAPRDPECETLRLDRIPGTDSWPFPTDIIPTALNLKIWPPDVNFGYSYQFGVSVMSMIGDRIVPTIELTIVSLLAAMTAMVTNRIVPPARLTPSRRLGQRWVARTPAAVTSGTTRANRSTSPVTALLQGVAPRCPPRPQ